MFVAGFWLLVDRGTCPAQRRGVVAVVKTARGCSSRCSNRRCSRSSQCLIGIGTLMSYRQEMRVIIRPDIHRGETPGEEGSRVGSYQCAGALYRGTPVELGLRSTHYYVLVAGRWLFVRCFNRHRRCAYNTRYYTASPGRPTTYNEQPNNRPRPLTSDH